MPGSVPTSHRFSTVTITLTMLRWPLSSVGAARSWVTMDLSPSSWAIAGKSHNSSIFAPRRLFLTEASTKVYGAHGTRKVCPISAAESSKVGLNYCNVVIIKQPIGI